MSAKRDIFTVGAQCLVPLLGNQPNLIPRDLTPACPERAKGVSPGSANFARSCAPEGVHEP
jgi:hypothetical protein